MDAALMMIGGSIAIVNGDSICAIEHIRSKAHDLTVMACSRVLW